MLSPSGLGEPLTGHLFPERLNDRRNGALIVVVHGLGCSRTIEDRLVHAELSVQLIRQVVDLTHEGVLDRTIELSDMFGSINVRDSVFRSGQLHLDVFLALGDSPLLHIVLDRIGKLNNKIKFRRVGLCVSVIQEPEFVHESLESRVRLIHDRVKRVLDDRHSRLRTSNLLNLPGQLVIDADIDVFGMPSNDLSCSHRVDIKGV